MLHPAKSHAALPPPYRQLYKTTSQQLISVIASVSAEGVNQSSVRREELV